MAQGDYIVDNGTGAVVRTDINTQLQAVLTVNSGTTEPASKTAYMLWTDTTANVLKQRNAANNAWITLFELAGLGAVQSSDLVLTSTDQDIAGVKNYISSPIVPAPTTDLQVATKKYVDDNVSDDFVANDSRVKTALNAGGTAPIYGCRAWINFNGTGVVSINASGNISSITDDGTGEYTCSFIVDIEDIHYISIGSTVGQENATSYRKNCVVYDKNVGSFKIQTGYVNELSSSKTDYANNSILIVR